MPTERTRSHIFVPLHIVNTELARYQRYLIIFPCPQTFSLIYPSQRVPNVHVTPLPSSDISINLCRRVQHVAPAPFTRRDRISLTINSCNFVGLHHKRTPPTADPRLTLQSSNIIHLQSFPPVPYLLSTRLDLAFSPAASPFKAHL